MDIQPILATLRRHKTAAALIVLEIALSCAIICNAVFLISQRLERMDRPTGMVDSELVRINIAGIGDRDKASALAREDVAALRATDEGVPQALSNWRPTVSLTGERGRQSIDYSPESATSQSGNMDPATLQLTVSQPLYRGGRTEAATDSAEALILAGRQDLASTERRVLLDAVTAYMDVTQNQAVLDLNPFYHLLHAVRAPLLGQPVHGKTYLVLVAMAVLGWGVTFLVFARTRRRIVHYL